MQRRKLLLGTLGILLASVIALTGCDDVLAKIQKGLGAADTAFPDFEEVVDQMAKDASGTQSATYTLNGGGVEDTYTDDLILTPGETCPATVTINGGPGGWVVTGTGTNSITVESGVTLTLTNITFTTLPFIVEANGKLVLATGAVVRDNNDNTGVIVDGGTLEMMDGAAIMDNSGGTYDAMQDVNMAGGVYMNGGVFTMSGGSISNNGAMYGGGVAMSGNNSTFTMTGGAITENSGFTGGGGIIICGNDAVFTMSGGLISNNIVWYIGGGGVYIDGGQNITFNMSGTAEISGHRTDYYGAGIRIVNGTTVNMSGGVIKNNEAFWDGGGMYVDNDTIINMTGGEITSNSALNGTGGGIWLNGTLEGNPQIGGTDPGPGRGWIHGNTPNDVGN
jgi:hypothetical protein